MRIGKVMPPIIVSASIVTPLPTRPQYIRWIPRLPKKNQSTYANATDLPTEHPPFLITETRNSHKVSVYQVNQTGRLSPNLRYAVTACLNVWEFALFALPQVVSITTPTEQPYHDRTSLTTAVSRGT